ncbi:MAG TPA: hypothetical protein VGQ92_30650 [Actinoplanes sp.]|nr:hypothetical protein [Actinoplanes sp.]
MAQWAVIIPAEQWATERLFQHDTVTVAGPAGIAAPVSGPPVSGPPVSGSPVSGPPVSGPPVSGSPVSGSPVSGSPVSGDDVLLIAGGDLPRAVALGSVKEVHDGELLVSYRRRAFDAPVPADELKLEADVTAVDAEAFQRLAARLGGDRDRLTWLVSLDLPIEATSPAEAVRQFWSYVLELGPAELPTFVSPSGNELAMQAFVLGEEVNLDPEEDEEG